MPLNLGIISDFTVDNLVSLLTRQGTDLGLNVRSASVGGYMEALTQSRSPFWNNAFDAVLVWTFPGAVVPRFNDVVEFRDWSGADLQREVEAFAQLVRTIAARARTVLVPTWVCPPSSSHGPSIELRPNLGTADAVLRMNCRLAESLEQESRVMLLNTERWIHRGGPSSFSDKLWYLSKTPFSRAVFDAAAKDITAVLKGIRGIRRKVVVLDLDETLWGGVVGEVGADGVRIGGHDPIGEAFAQFQIELKRLSQQGVLLAVVSKNEEQVALSAIDQRAEMVIRTSDLAAWRINWCDKAANIVELMTDLNLGLDSAVFIDDNPHERDRVRQALPEVLVPDWPTDPMDYAAALRELRCFEAPTVSTEDRARTSMYLSDRQRTALRSEAESFETWLEMLKLEIEVEGLTPANVERTAQLLNKTNQMNLSTRRLSVAELMDWATASGHRLWAFRVKDRIGDYGLCGIASIVDNGRTATLVDFVLSCRAMGRGVEGAMISVVAEEAHRSGKRSLTAVYKPTKKNVPMRRWLDEASPFVRQADGDVFELSIDPPMSPPRHVQLLARVP